MSLETFFAHVYTTVEMLISKIKQDYPLVNTIAKNLIYVFMKFLDLAYTINEILIRNIGLCLYRVIF